MSHAGTEIAAKIIGAGIEVHRHLGPGLLESVNEAASPFELGQRGLALERQKPLPLVDKDLKLDEGYRADRLGAGSVSVELKCVDTFLPSHEAQALSSLKLTGLKAGLLINFKAPVLKQGHMRLSG